MYSVRRGLVHSDGGGDPVHSDEGIPCIVMRGILYRVLKDSCL